MAGLKAYDLQEEALELLLGMAMWKIRRFLRTGLRLRTACDFTCKGLMTINPENFNVPEEGELADIISKNIELCKQKGYFNEDIVTES